MTIKMRKKIKSDKKKKEEKEKVVGKENLEVNVVNVNNKMKVHDETTFDEVPDLNKRRFIIDYLDKKYFMFFLECF